MLCIEIRNLAVSVESALAARSRERRKCGKPPRIPPVSSFRAEYISLRNLIGQQNVAGRRVRVCLRARVNGSEEDSQEGEEGNQEVFRQEGREEGRGEEGVQGRQVNHRVDRQWCCWSRLFVFS